MQSLPYLDFLTSEKFSLFTAKCNPPCENGGTCQSVNFCSCTNDYRGNACQYRK